MDLDKLSPHNTGGLPYIVEVAIGARWILTKNIDIEDGLVNGASGTITDMNISTDDKLKGIIFVKFDNREIGRKRRTANTVSTPIEAVTARFNLSERAAVTFVCFGVLRRFQHCTGHITTGSWKGRGNQYI